jgi:hypothetical protein
LARVFCLASSGMSALEKFCNATLYSSVDTRVRTTYGWMSVLVLLQIATALVAAYPLLLYFRLDRSRRAKLWIRFLPFFLLIFIGAVAGAAGWSCNMEYLVAFQITTTLGAPPEFYPDRPDPAAQPMSYWFSRSFGYLTSFTIFFPVEFTCFVVSKMFILERLLTFGTSTMGQSSSIRARRVFKWTLVALSVLLLAIIASGWASAALSYPFSQKGRQLNNYDKADRDDAVIEAAFAKLLAALSALFILIALVLLIAAITCALFFVYCFQRMQQVSSALLQSQNMSTAKVQAVEANLRKTRLLIIGTSAVVTVSFVVRAAFQILYGVALAAPYKVSCNYQCRVGCQSDLFVLQVTRASAACSLLNSSAVPGYSQVFSCLRNHHHRGVSVSLLHIRFMDHDLQSKGAALPRQQQRQRQRHAKSKHANLPRNRMKECSYSYM